MMNNDIFPCLWFDGDAKKAAEMYCEVFKGRIAKESSMVLDVEVFNQKLMLLNGGPHFQKNASISLMVLCESEEEVQNYWDKLSKNGTVLMELGSYPWSKKYGWVKDQFGLTWQLYLGENRSEQKIVPTLMFIHENNGKASEAMNLYTKIFPNSKIGKVLKYGEGIGNETHEEAENVQHADFMINHYTLFCMDNSYDHQFDFDEGISMVVMTNNQDETDHYWNSFVKNEGKESRCGWLKDKFGMNWQIVPKKLIELMNDSNQEKAQKAFTEMLTMNKIVISDIEKAFNS